MRHCTRMFTFVSAVFLLIISPGPGVLTTAGTGAAYGYNSGLSYVTGLFIGMVLTYTQVLNRYDMYFSL